ncbi:hypothetical protein M5G22_16975 [Pseudomonas sp. TNT2022 ID233]|uniref:hypothetical protein n=1 Tax=Pseudomonas aphyarum TaxID=2942629 RepID=UPI002360BA84|nr:hypothetical protein [Pseudomonas aphyarum]MDD1139250.1 hypothetical protein [Pseudomonas aphyarum]
MKMELAMYQALRAIDVPELKAEAVIQALESDMLTLLATKSDLASLTAEIGKATAEIANTNHRLTAEIAKSDLKLSIRMASMLAVTIGILIGAMKVFL